MKRTTKAKVTAVFLSALFAISPMTTVYAQATAPNSIATDQTEIVSVNEETKPEEKPEETKTSKESVAVDVVNSDTVKTNVGTDDSITDGSANMEPSVSEDKIDSEASDTEVKNNVEEPVEETVESETGKDVEKTEDEKGEVPENEPASSAKEDTSVNQKEPVQPVAPAMTDGKTTKTERSKEALNFITELDAFDEKSFLDCVKEFRDLSASVSSAPKAELEKVQQAAGEAGDKVDAMYADLSSIAEMYEALSETDKADTKVVDAYTILKNIMSEADTIMGNDPVLMNYIVSNLDVDDQYIYRLWQDSMTTGTEPFDADNNPGNDSAPDNRVVRSFDTVVYNVGLTTASYTLNKYYETGYVWYKVVVPGDSTQVTFDTSAMSWMATDEEHKWAITEETVDGKLSQVLTCARFLSPAQGQDNAFPAYDVKVPIVVKVLSMLNGETITPTVSSWVDHNTTTGTCLTHNKNEVVRIVLDTVTVSSAPSYNIVIKRVNSNDLWTGWPYMKDLAEAPYEGSREYGEKYGLNLRGLFLIQARATDSNKGSRGTQTLDAQKIEFDLVFNDKYTTNSGNVYEYKGQEALPYIWSNQPYATNSGTWTATRETDRIHVVVTDFDKKVVDSNGTFAGQEFNFFHVLGNSDNDWLYKNYGSGTYQQSIADCNMKIPGVAESDTNTNQSITDDDVLVRTDYYAAGNYSNTLLYSAIKGDHPFYFQDADGLSDEASGGKRGNGTDTATLGQEIAVQFGYSTSLYADTEEDFKAANCLLKFDPKVMTPIHQDNDYHMIIKGGLTAEEKSNYYYNEGENAVNPTYTTLFVAKSDKTGWTNYDEMQDTKEGDPNLVYFRTIDELQAQGYTCVALLLEYRCDEIAMYYRAAGRNLIRTVKQLFRVNNDSSLLGDVSYIITEDSNAWSKANVEAMGIENIPSRIDVGNQDIARGDIHNSGNTKDGGAEYVPAQYENGMYIGGHTGTDNIGDSLYLIPYKTHITHEIEQLVGDVEKTTFDIGNSQTIVDYKVTPWASSGGSQASGTEITVKVNVPAGTTYVPNSAIQGGEYVQSEKVGYHGTINGGAANEPTVGTDDSGNQTLTWIFPNTMIQTQAEDGTYTSNIPVIHYSVKIDAENAKTSAHYDSTASVSAPGDKEVKSASTGFTVVKTAALSYDKNADSRFITIGKEDGFALNWNNFGASGIQNSVFMDTMPKNGDEMGTSINGEYSVTELTVKAPEDASLSDYKMYYTTDAAATGKYSPDYTVDDVKGWTEITIPGDGKIAIGSGAGQFPATGVTAWALIGGLNPSTKLSAHITFLCDNNCKVGDTMVNSISTGLNPPTNSEFTVIKRQLAGLIWKDENKDGLQSADESAHISGVTVTLSKKDGTVVGTTTTDANGAFLFDNIPEGDMSVKFSSNTNVNLNQYRVTLANVGDNDNIDCDTDSFTTDEFNNLDTATITTIPMPADKDITEDMVVNGVYKSEHHDMGVYNMKPLAAAVIVGLKTMTDVNNKNVQIPAGKFSVLFEDLSTDKSGCKWDMTKNVIPIETNGRFQLPSLSFLKAGIYTFKVSEKLPDDPNYRYDETYWVIVYDVTIQDNSLVSKRTITQHNADDSTKTVTAMNLNNKEIPIVKPNKTISDASAAGKNNSIVGLGNVITYRISWSNTTTKKQDIKIVDTPSVGLTFNPNSVTYSKAYNNKTGKEITPNIKIENGKPTWTITGAESGDYGYIEYTMTVNDKATAMVNNDMKLTYSKDTTVYTKSIHNPTINKKYSDNTVAGKDNTAVKVGDEISYTISFGNGKDAKSTVLIKDTMSKGLTYKDGSASITPVSVNKNILNGTTTLLWKVEAEAYYTGAITYTAVVNEKALDDVLVNNIASVQTEGEEFIDTDKLTNPVPSKQYAEKTPSGDNGSLVRPNDVIGYSIRYCNPKKDAQTITVVDTMQKGLTYNKDSASIAPNKVETNDSGITTLTWVIPNVKYEEVGMITYQATVNQDSIPLHKVANTATTQVGVGDKADKPVQLETLINPVPSKDYASGTKNGTNGSTLHVNDEVIYTIFYGNGEKTAQNVVIKDTMSKGLEYKSGSCAAGDPSITKNFGGTTTLTWELKNVEPGKITELTYTAVVTEDAKSNAIVSNTANVTVGRETTKQVETLYNEVPNKQYAEKTPTGDNGSLVRPDDVIGYTLRYSNTKVGNTTITVVDTMQKGLTYIKDSANIAPNKVETNGDGITTLTWIIPNLKYAETGMITYQAKVNSDAIPLHQVVNTATVQNGNTQTGEGTDNEKPTPLDTLINPVPSKTYSTETKHGANGDSVRVNDEIVYTIFFGNGEKTAQTVVIEDVMSKGLTYKKGSCAWGDPAVAQDKDGKTTLVWELKNVNAGENTSLTYTATVNKDAETVVLATNTAYVKVGNEPTKHVETLYNPVPTKSYSEKSQYGKGGGDVCLGNEITYQIDFANPTDADTTVTISDVLDKNVEYVENSASNEGKYDSKTRTLTWSINMKPHSTANVTFTVKVETSADSADIYNTADVRVNGYDIFKTNTLKNHVDNRNEDPPKTPVPGTPNNQGQTPNPTKPQIIPFAPQTSDSFPIIVIGGICAMAAVGIIVMSFLKKRKKDEDAESK